ncbi:MAG: hypothetical protein WCO63_00360 [Bacteroidota bacterium]
MAYQTINSNPFPGIRSYEPSEDELFFGRERRIRELIDKLAVTRFLAIVGSSGCGKSSLIKAGLIPSLVKNKYIQNPDEWKLILFRPGSDPIGNLSEALLRCFGKESEPDKNKFHKKLLQSPDALPEIIKMLGGRSTASYLLVIDQFEELFRFRQNTILENAEAEAARFVELFLYATQQSEVKISLVLSMRTDFMDDCTEYPHLNEAINKGYYLVPRMNAEEKRLAISGPLSVRGCNISSDLLDRLLDDVGDDPDQLPIMQHALMRTYDYWSTYRIGNEAIDIAHYEAIGTMKEALSVHCEEVFNELRLPALQFIAEKVFKALTDFGSDSRGTRRPTKFSELCVVSEAKPDEVSKVIDSFREAGRAFLMPSYNVECTDSTIIDISHESIMRVWKRLRKWVDEESQSAQLYLRLSKSAELYQYGQSALWINPELQLALQWQHSNKPNNTWAMRYDPAFDRAMEFLNYSQQQFDLEIRRKEELQKRNLRRARNFAMFLGGATIVSILFLVVSLNLRFKAESSRKDALEKQKLAVFESKRAEDQRQEAIIQKRISEQQQQIAEQQKLITEEQRQYAVSQQNIAEVKTVEAVQQKLKADKSRQEAVKARDETEIQRKEAVSQKQIAEKERVKAENSEKNTQRLRLLSIAKSMAVQASQLSLTVKDDLPALLAIQAYHFNQDNGGPKDDPDLYEALSGVTNDQEVLRGHDDAVRAMAISSDGLQLITTGDDGKVLAWDLSDPSKKPLSVNTGSYGKEGIRAVALSTNWIMAGCFNGKILVWNRKLPQAQPKVINGHSGQISCIVYDQSNDQFASAGGDGKLCLWKWNNSTFQKSILDSTNSDIRALAFDPSSKCFAYGCSNGLLKFVNPGLPSKNVIVSPMGGSAILSLAFHPGGSQLLAGDAKGSLRFYKINSIAVLTNELIGRHTSGILSIACSKDGKFVSTAGFDKTIRTNTLSGEIEDAYSINRNDLWVYGILFSNDGKRLISCSADKTIRLYTAGCEPLASLAEKSIKRNLSKDEWNLYVSPDIPYQKTINRLP